MDFRRAAPLAVTACRPAAGCRPPASAREGIAQPLQLLGRRLLVDAQVGVHRDGLLVLRHRLGEAVPLPELGERLLERREARGVLRGEAALGLGRAALPVGVGEHRGEQLVPLALLRDLSSLAIGSVIGTSGTLYTALFCFLRFVDKSYATGGKFFGMLAEGAKPLFAAPTVAKPLFNP